MHQNYHMKISAFPLVKAACCFIAGMLAFPFIYCYCWKLPFFIAICYGLLDFISSVSGWHRWAIHVSLYCLAFTLGNYFYSSHYKKVHLSSLPEEYDSFIATFEQQPQQKKYYIEAKLSIAPKQRALSGRCKFQTNILAKFSLTDAEILYFQKGDHITFEGCPMQIPLQKNPQRFQRRSHLFYQGIVQQIQIREGCWSKSEIKTPYNIAVKLEKIRRNFAKDLDNRIEEPRARAIVKALLLGIRDGMPAEILQSFSNTGAIHVLAVSGLHVGAMLFIFIWGIKKLTNRNKRLKWLPLITLVPLAFFYMMITGFSSSVIRSVIMFCTILIGKTWFKNTNSVNLLFVCAVWMLLYNPFYIHDLSFQFSFLSLLGILLFQPELKKWWLPQNKITLYIWELTSVSLAAQIFVFPLSIYYFHQFPVYFIPASLLAVPLAILLVYGGLLLPVIIYTDIFFQKLYLDLYSGLVWLLDTSMCCIESWPFSVWRYIYFDVWDVLGLYVIVASLLFFIQVKSRNALCVASLLMLILMVKFMVRDVGQNRQFKFCFYELRRGHLADVYFGKMAFVMKSKNLEFTTEKFNSNYNRLKQGIQDVIYLNDSIEVKAQDVEFNHGVGKIFNTYWCTNFTTYSKLKDSINFSIVFITREDHHVCLDNIRLSPKTLVVLSGDLGRKMKKDWVKYLNKKQLPFVDISQHGYFEWDVSSS